MKTNGDLSREVGVLSQRLDDQDKKLETIGNDVKALLEYMHASKGGMRVLVSVAGAASVVGGICVAIWQGLAGRS